MIAALLLCAAWTLGPFDADTTSLEWSRLAMKLKGDTCASFSFESHDIEMCRDRLTGWATIYETPFYLRGTDYKLFEGRFHA